MTVVPLPTCHCATFFSWSSSLERLRQTPDWEHCIRRFRRDFQPPYLPVISWLLSSFGLLANLHTSLIRLAWFSSVKGGNIQSTKFLWFTYFLPWHCVWFGWSPPKKRCLFSKQPFSQLMSFQFPGILTFFFSFQFFSCIYIYIFMG